MRPRYKFSAPLCPRSITTVLQNCFEYFATSWQQDRQAQSSHTVASPETTVHKSSLLPRKAVLGILYVGHYGSVQLSSFCATIGATSNDRIYYFKETLSKLLFGERLILDLVSPLVGSNTILTPPPPPMISGCKNLLLSAWIMQQFMTNQQFLASLQPPAAQLAHSGRQQEYFFFLHRLNNSPPPLPRGSSFPVSHSSPFAALIIV